jgi:methyl-accepting chemotaxis protein I, serine sensor receptor
MPLIGLMATVGGLKIGSVFISVGWPTQYLAAHVSLTDGRPRWYRAGRRELAMRRSLRLTLWGLVLPAALAAMVILAISLFSFRSLDGNARRALVAQDVVADILPPPLYLIEMRLVLSQAVEQSISLKEARERFDKLATDYQTRVDYWRAHPPYGLESVLLGRQHVEAQRFISVAREQVMARLEAGDRAGAATGLHEAHAAYLAHRAGVDDTVQAGNRFVESAMADFDNTTRRGVWLMPLCAALLLGLTVAFGVLVIRRLIEAVRQCADVARRVAAGDLRDHVNVQRQDEIGELLQAMNDMSDSLSHIVDTVRDGSHAIAQATAEIAQGNMDLSARTESQAASLQQTTASVTEMAGALRSGADSSQRADERARGASNRADEGHAAVTTLVNTMRDIQASSRRVADIVGVIDGLSFQTNILALNAAVEAARAGEQGRGFSVVAAEVRSLALRSTQAAQEIRNLIAGTTREVEAGGQHAEHAGQSIASMVSEVGHITALVGEISQGSHQQSEGFAQINSALSQIDSVTQQNSALVEQTAAAAASLSHQAEQLARAVDIFQTREHPHALPV